MAARLAMMPATHGGQRAGAHGAAMASITAALRATRVAAAGGLAVEPVDHERWLQIARSHGVCGVLFSRLSGAALPEPLRSRLAASALALGVSGRFRCERLLELLRAAEGLVPLRGPLLSARLYGDATLRPGQDLDVLALGADGYRRAAAFLRGRGFVTAEKEAVSGGYHEVYTDPGSGVRVELHRRLMNPDLLPDGYKMTFAPRPFEGLTYAAPDAVDELVLACLHAWKHGWSRLLDLLDITVAAAALSDAQAGETLARAAKAGVRRAVQAGVAAAHAALDLPRPAGFGHAGVAERMMAGWVRRALDVDPAVRNPWRAWQGELIMSLGFDRRRRRWAYLMHVLGRWLARAACRVFTAPGPNGGFGVHAEWWHA